MNDIAIRVENLSKLYKIGSRQQGYKTLRESIMSALMAPFGGLRRAKSNDLRDNSSLSAPSSKLYADTIWALKDASFEVKRGEVVGIIGPNGAGKTTLLKILSRITEPTEGYANIHGRVGSLLEIGTGFHSELTGRENIYLNGAILGMKKVEIDRKFDEIVDFSGVEKFIDTPVKRYSGGMHVRLAFSVAAHLDLEILLIDEVLAVGDVVFQKKCLGKMGDVVKEGRTILFVSHNMAAVRSLCGRTILLNSGRIVADDNTSKVIAKYLDRSLQLGSVATQEYIEERLEGVILRDRPTIRLREVTLLDERGLPRNDFRSDESVRISVTYECLTDVRDIQVIIYILNTEDDCILITQNQDSESYAKFFRLQPGTYRSQCVFPPNLFGQKRFYVSLHLRHASIEDLVLDRVLFFDIRFTGYNDVVNPSRTAANTYIRPKLTWETEEI